MGPLATGHYKGMKGGLFMLKTSSYDSYIRQDAQIRLVKPIISVAL